MNKTISPLWAIVGALVLGAAIYGFTAPSKAKPWTPPKVTEDATYEFMQDIGRETGITFTFMIDKEFPWIGRQDEKIVNMMISGKQWMAPEMTEEQWTAITTYFTSHGFQQDVTNVGANPNQWMQDAYKKNDMVCTIVHMAHTQGNLILELPTGMTLSCGPNLLETVYVPTTQESITNSLAATLEIPRSKITAVTVEKEWDLEQTHVIRGTYLRADEPYPKTFIVRKTDVWQVVMSGDEGVITCETLRTSLGTNTVPEDLLTSCFEE